MTHPEILFDVYEYRTGVFLPKAYVVGRSEAGRLVHVHHTARVDGLGAYDIELTEPLLRALQLVQLLRPAAVAESFRGGSRKSPTLPGLLSTKSKERPQVIRHVQHRLAEVLDLCKTHGWAVTVNLNVRGVPEEDTVKFLAKDPSPKISFQLSETGLSYQLQLLDAEENTSLIRYHKWKVITNSPSPGWLLCDRHLIRLGHLNGNHIKPFLSRDKVQVPPEEVADFWRKFVVKIARRHTLEVSGFGYAEVDQPDRLRLEAKLHPFEHRYLLYPTIFYGDRSYAPNDAEQNDVAFSVTPPYWLKRIIRNPAAEAELMGLLAPFALHPLPSTNALAVALDNDRFAALRWLLEKQDDLRQLGVEVLLPEHQGHIFSRETGNIELSFGELDDWLDLRGTVTVGKFTIPFARLVRFIQKEERCFPLPDGSIFLIPEDWFAKYKPSFQFAKTEGKQVKLARSQAPLLASLGLEVPLEDVAELVENFKPSTSLKADLRPYQLAGVKWLVRHYHQQLGACLADDMGLGKTLQTITVLQYAKEQLGADAGAKQGPEPAPKPMATQMDLFAPPAEDEVFLQPLRALIVLPASLVYNWRAELTRFTPGLSVEIHTGPKRHKDARLLRRFDVLLTTYQTALRDKDLLKEIDFTYIVLDESQQIKNRSSKIFRALNEFSATHRISLSGTPIENSLSDLWSQMQFINPGLLRGYAFFKQEFIDPIEQHDDEKQKAQLRQLVTPHLLRRTKAEVAPDLPELEVQTFYCEMSEAQRKIYEREKSAARNALLGNYAPEDGQYRLRVIQTLTRLRQLANHPSLMQEDYTGDSGKFTDVLDQWRTVRRSGQKVLIFSSMVSHLELFKAELIREKEDFAWITGSVKGEDRAREVTRFQSDPKLSTFFISIKAGGTGLNLTAADYVFILDPWWNPSIEDQAIARAHRIGRVGNVFARKFISRGTIEEKINRLQQRKKKLAEDILGGSGSQSFDRGELGFLLE
ncbi:DEAD/DEAH box helicase [Lewinella sp. 4G2]|uniref:DEAD/DEAH box helicase n=1 Tax=Lewinella sp. 4G2 TaxID=1803372 RepID=UPI0007B49BB9|nr:DEAD/DEAH box helicase [Lewinella sp. 4G2]